MAFEGDQLSRDLASLRIRRDERPARTGFVKPLIYVAIIGAIVAVVAIFGYPYLASRVFKTQVEVTELSMVSPAQSSVNLTSTGYVRPQITAKVAAKGIGRIAHLAVKEGQVVKAGATIAQLEDSDAKSAIATARSRVSASRARTQTARAQLAETQLLLSRERTLLEKGVSPKASVEDLAAKEHSLAEAVKAADADTKAAEAEVASLEVSLANLTVTAPIDGTIITKTADIGESVGGPGTGIIVEMADFASLAVECDVPESKLRQIGANGPAEIVLDAFPDRRLRGEVLEIGRKVDRSKGTVVVKVKFKDSPGDALPDMAARVNFLAKELDAQSIKEPPKLVVPARALADRNGGKVVFIVDGGKLRMTPVVLGDSFGGGFVVKQGPPAGTKVVASPAPELRDGQSIKERTE